MHKDKEISDYQTKIKDFLKDKNCDITIHKYSRGKNKKINKSFINRTWMEQNEATSIRVI